MNDAARIAEWERRQTEDHELLTLAAKAAGLPLEWRDVMSADFRSRSLRSYLRVPSPHGWDKRMTDLVAWNPLHDDGDALRLAVKLRLNISFTRGLGPGHKDEYMQVSPATLGHLAEFGPLGEDAEETIRLAIVRAAAAIGEQHG